MKKCDVCQHEMVDMISSSFCPNEGNHRGSIATSAQILSVNDYIRYVDTKSLPAKSHGLKSLYEAHLSAHSEESKRDVGNVYVNPYYPHTDTRASEYVSQRTSLEKARDIINRLESIADEFEELREEHRYEDIGIGIHFLAGASDLVTSAWSVIDDMCTALEKKEK